MKTLLCFLLILSAQFSFAQRTAVQDTTPAKEEDSTGFTTLKEVNISADPTKIFQPISKIDISIKQVNNSQEVLRLVPGLFIGQHAGGGKAEQIFMRGFDIDHGTDILLTVDEMPVNMVSHAHGQGYADLHFVIPELIEKVDFKKGTYYADKGNFATSGYVNFKTTDQLKHNSIKLEAGMFDTYRSMAAINLLNSTAAAKGQTAYVAGEYMFTNGYFDAPQDFNRLNLLAKYHGKLNQNNTLNISASSFGSSWTASGQIPERAVAQGMIGYYGAIDPNEGGKTYRKNVNALLTTSLSNGAVLKNRLYYSRYHFELYSNFTFFKVDGINGDQIRQKEKRNLLGFNSSYEVIGFIGQKKLHTEAGISIRKDDSKDSELSRTKNRTQILQRISLGDIHETNLAGYLNETLSLTERVTLNAGLRFDHFTARYTDKINASGSGKQTASILSPKLNLFYQHNSKTQFYISAGKGFHSNDSRAVVSKQGLEILPAAWGADIGTVMKPFQNLLINAAVWYLKLDQEFVYVGDEGIVEPSGRSLRYGIDFSARYEPARWLIIDADLNYARPRSIDEPKGNDHIPLAPIFTATGGISFKNKNGLQLSIRNRYMADRPANEDNSTIAEGYLVHDLFINFPRNRFDVNLAIQNLFDVKWKETQFDTESRLLNERDPVTEIHFTPGTKFFLKASVNYRF